MLHITNGDSTVRGLQAAGLPGDFLPWRDVLHAGPVPASLAPAALDEVRAGFLAAAGWAPLADVRRDFAARAGRLARSSADDEIVLWFEHDLYDQLQMLQILDGFAGRPPGGPPLQLIAIDRFPGVTPFYGLGQLRPADLVTLFPERVPVSAAALRLAQTAWAAFRAPDPRGLNALLLGDTAALPLLAAALRRLAEEYPAQGDGLSRSERAILAAVAAGRDTPGAIFATLLAQEAAPFLSDRACWALVAGLVADPAPLLQAAGGERFVPPVDAASAGQRLALTAAGRAVLAGQADAIHLRGIDRWIGGTHLQGPEAAWRWDAAAARLTPASLPAA